MATIERLLGGVLVFVNEVKDWIRRMGRDEHSRCMLHNLFAREIRFRHLPTYVLLGFFNRLGSRIADGAYRDYDEPKRLVVNACDIPPSYILQGPRVPSEEIDVSRVMRISDLLKHHGGELGAAYDRDRTNHRIYMEISTGKLRAEHLRRNWSGARSMCWITKTQSIEDLRRTIPLAELATRIRDVLGKKGWEADEHIYLIEVTYPSGFLARNAVHVPTVLDGGDCVCFRPHQEPDGWGRTVDLQTLRIGLPEAVHPEMPVTPHFGLRPLGKINRNSPGFTFKHLMLKSKEML